MKDTSLVAQLWRRLPELPKRLWSVVQNPVIPVGRTPGSTLIEAAVDLFTVTAASGALVGVGFALIPGLLDIEPDELVNWPLFVLMLLTNAAGFAVTLYLVCLPLLAIPARHAHLQLLTHTLYVYSILNILVTILFVLAVDRIVVNSSVIEPTSQLDLLLGGLVGIVAIALVIRGLALALARYLRNYYSRACAFACAFAAMIVASSLNPVIASGYFEHVLEREDLCSAIVSVRYQPELASGQYSRDCLVASCTASFPEQFVAQSSAAAPAACPSSHQFPAR